MLYRKHYFNFVYLYCLRCLIDHFEITDITIPHLLHFILYLFYLKIIIIYLIIIIILLTLKLLLIFNDFRHLLMPIRIHSGYCRRQMINICLQLLSQIWLVICHHLQISLQFINHLLMLFLHCIVAHSVFNVSDSLFELIHLLFNLIRLVHDFLQPSINMCYDIISLLSSTTSIFIESNSEFINCFFHRINIFEVLFFDFNTSFLQIDFRGIQLVLKQLNFTYRFIKAHLLRIFNLLENLLCMRVELRIHSFQSLLRWVLRLFIMQ